MKEIIIYLPFDRDRPPLNIARDMVGQLEVGRVELGVDALTGGVEMRVFYEETLLRRIREYLTEQGVAFDISLL